MTVSNQNPASSSLIRRGDTITFEFDDGGTPPALLLLEVSGSAVELAWSASGGFTAGYTGSATKVGNVYTVSVSRDAGWDASPLELAVRAVVGGVTTSYEWSYELSSEQLFAKKMQPRNPLAQGVFDITEGGQVRARDVKQIDFDDGDFNVTPSADGESVTVETTAAGGGGVSDFTDLDDAPNSYSGEGGKLVAVKGAEDGVEFVDAPSGGSTSLLGLDDVDEATYSGQANKLVTVKGDETGVEFTTPTVTAPQYDMGSWQWSNGSGTPAAGRVTGSNDAAWSSITWLRFHDENTSGDQYEGLFENLKAGTQIRIDGNSGGIYYEVVSITNDTDYTQVNVTYIQRDSNTQLGPINAGTYSPMTFPGDEGSGGGGGGGNLQVAVGVLTADVPAGTGISNPTNIDSALLDYVDDATFAGGNVRIYINGRIQRMGVNAAANYDVYPSGSASNGDFTCEYDLKSGDVIQMHIGGGTEVTAAVDSATAGDGLVNSGTSADPVFDVVSIHPALDVNANDVNLIPGNLNHDDLQNHSTEKHRRVIHDTSANKSQYFTGAAGNFDVSTGDYYLETDNDALFWYNGGWQSVASGGGGGGGSEYANALAGTWDKQSDGTGAVSAGGIRFDDSASLSSATVMKLHATDKNADDYAHHLQGWGTGNVIVRVHLAADMSVYHDFFVDSSSNLLFPTAGTGTLAISSIGGSVNSFGASVELRISYVPTRARLITYTHTAEFDSGGNTTNYYYPAKGAAFDKPDAYTFGDPAYPPTTLTNDQIGWEPPAEGKLVKVMFTVAHNDATAPTPSLLGYGTIGIIKYNRSLNNVAGTATSLGSVWEPILTPALSGATGWLSRNFINTNADIVSGDTIMPCFKRYDSNSPKSFMCQVTYVYLIGV